MKKKIKNIAQITSIVIALTGAFGLFTNATRVGADLPTEDDYYKIVKLPIPEGIVMEVGGMTQLPNEHHGRR
ncbi:MAG: hypothetical protein U5L45_16605 [Saprospiraceae bacterium]|nr:hypothetical protein [Saprospiraceae bacterium]